MTYMRGPLESSTAWSYLGKLFFDGRGLENFDEGVQKFWLVDDGHNSDNLG